MIQYIKDNKIKFPEEITLIIDGQEINNPTREQLLENGWIVYSHLDYDLGFQKRKKTAELNIYDHSVEVNSFFVGDIQAWIDRDTRVSLMNSTKILKNSGQETTTLWLNGQSFTIPCDSLIQMLGVLEVYALQCYNVTEQHKTNVNNLETIEEIKNYDFKVGYPEKLVFSIQ